jgi:outer membrane protein
MYTTLPFQRALGVAVLLLTASSAAAQTPLTLDDAITRALRQNAAVRATAAAGDEAAARTVQARAGWLPRLELSESWQKGNQPVFVFGSLLGQRRFTQNDFRLEALNQPDAIPNYRAAVTIEQTLFDGMRTPAAVRAATIGQELAAIAKQDVASSLRVGVTQAYGGVLMSMAHKRAANAAVESAAEDLRRIERRRDAGMATEADVLALQVHVAQMRARAITASGQETIARAQLNDAMGEPLDAPFALTDVQDTTSVVPPAGTVETEAVAQRPETRRALAMERLARTNVTMARAGFLPVAGVQGMVEGNGGTFGDRAKSWSVGAVVKWNVFAGFADHARLGEARAAVARASAERDRADAQVRLDVRAAVAALESARAREDVGRSAVAQARESQRITRDRYESGLATVSDLLRAANAVLEADLNQTSATVDSIVSAAMLARALGK